MFGRLVGCGKSTTPLVARKRTWYIVSIGVNITWFSALKKEVVLRL